MPEQLGVANLKKAILFALDLSEQIVKAAKNGIQWTDAFGFIDEVMQIPAIIKTGKEIQTELADLSPAERLQLNAEIGAAYDIDNNKVEAIIEHSFDVAFGIVALVNAIKERNIEREAKG